MAYRFLLTLYLLCSIIAVVISACTLSQLPISYALTIAMRGYAGIGSLDCGVVSVREAQAAANRCVDAAYQAKRAFTVRYNLPGIDSAIAEGLASNGQGEVRAYHYDSDPSGGSHVGVRVDERPCQAIKPIHDDWGGRRGCEP